MRNLKLQMQLTLDGFVAGPKSEMDWMTWNWDDGLNDYVTGITQNIDCIILGRKLAEGFIPTWESRLADPETADMGAEIMVNTPKIVFTKTMQTNPWNNTQLAHGELTQEINKLKAQPGKDMMTYGGAGLASSLIKENLIDEYHLFINPVAIGQGLTIFKEITGNFKLKLVKSQSFECGITVLVYHPQNL